MIDRDALIELREAVQSLHATRTGPKRYSEIAKLAGIAPLRRGATIDLDASELLGVPLVVVREISGSSELSMLSARESEVCGLVAEGLSNKEIARKLSISISTVKDHVHHILSKANLPNRAAIASARSRSS